MWTTTSRVLIAILALAMTCTQEPAQAQNVPVPALVAPTGMAIGGSILMVVDQAQNLIEFFNWRTLQKQPYVIRAGLNQPARIASDWQGHIYVANIGAPSITVYSFSGTSQNPSFTLTATCPLASGSRPLGIAVDPYTHYLFWIDNAAGNLSVFQQKNGALCGAVSSATLQLSAPGALYFNTADHDLWIAQGPTTGENSIQAYNYKQLEFPSQAYLPSIPPVFNVTNGVHGPTGIGFGFAPGNHGLLLVSNLYSGNITYGDPQAQPIVLSSSSSGPTAECGNFQYG